MPETGSYRIVTKARPTFYFVGVTTARSSIMQIFPRWMKALGRPEMVIQGIDHPIHDRPEAYRQGDPCHRHGHRHPRLARHG